MISGIIHRIRKLLGLRWQTYQVAGHPVKVLLGTFRPDPDYDDAWFLACSRRATVLFDVGSNVGYDSLIALVGSNLEKVVLFDPNRKALDIALENLAENGFSDRVDSVEAFVSNEDGEEMEFFTVGAGAAGSMFKTHAKSGAKEGATRVPTISLDQYLARGATPPDLVKVDVEGAESLVLDGATELTAKHSPRYLVEMHSSDELGMVANAERILSWCEKHGYCAHYLKEHRALESPELIAGRGRCHLLLQPETLDYPDWLRPIPQNGALSLAMT